MRSHANQQAAKPPKSYGAYLVNVELTSNQSLDEQTKDRDDWLRYFSVRNSLIVNPLYGRTNRTETARFLLKQLLLYIVSMRYGLAAILIMALEDFLSGPNSTAASKRPRSGRLRVEHDAPAGRHCPRCLRRPLRETRRDRGRNATATVRLNRSKR